MIIILLLSLLLYLRSGRLSLRLMVCLWCGKWVWPGLPFAACDASFRSADGHWVFLHTHCRAVLFGELVLQRQLAIEQLKLWHAEEEEKAEVSLLRRERGSVRWAVSRRLEGWRECGGRLDGGERYKPLIACLLSLILHFHISPNSACAGGVLTCFV